MRTPGYGPWHTYWLVWFIAFIATFLGPEIYALCTDWRRTLSAAVWYLEDIHKGAPISSWTAFHFLFAGVMALMFLWLLMHFAFQWWT